MQKIIINEVVDATYINKSQDYKIVVDSLDDLKIKLEIAENVTTNLYLEIEKAKNISLEIIGNPNSDAHLFILNENEEALVLDNTNHLLNGAKLNLSFVEINEAESKISSMTHLDEEYARCDLNSSLLVKSHKDVDVMIEHHARNTEGYMNLNAVVLDSGDYSMQATGAIDHLAIGSKSHQKSKALTFGEQKRARLLPKLIIDENDVEASHATVLGQIDEAQMYYLQSRGLNKAEATNLVTVGYLVPIITSIQDEEYQAQMKERITKKVEEICSM